MGTTAAPVLEITIIHTAVGGDMFRLALALALSSAVCGAAVADSRISRPAPGEPLTGTITIEVDAPADSARVDVFVDDLLIGTLRQHPWILRHEAGFTMEPRSIRAVVWGPDMKSRELVERHASAFRVDAEITVEMVEVPLTIRGRASVVASDLIVRENGRTQEIVELKPVRPDTHFVFVIDRSLSMRNGRLESALAAVRTFSRTLRRGDTSEVIFFNHTVSPPVAVSAPAPSASGGTALFDALASIDTQRRSFVVVLSDAHDRHSVATAADVHDLMRSRGVTLFAVTMQRGSASTLLASLAETTGGIAVQTRDPDDGMRRILQFLSERMMLVYRSSNDGSGWRAIEVQPLTRGIRISDARKGYLAQ